MKMTIAALAAVPSIASTSALANPSYYDAGYSAGYRLGTCIGQLINQFGPYLGLFAFMVFVWRIRSCRGKSAAASGSDG